jgi:hypothetical protein
LVVAPPHFGAGTAEVRVLVGTDIALDSLELRLDGKPIANTSYTESDGVRAVVEVGAGDHEIRARARLSSDANRVVETQIRFATPPGFGAWLAGHPAHGAVAAPRSSWVVLDFESPPEPVALESVRFECDGGAQPFRAHVEGNRLLLDPTPELPDAARCRVAWRGQQGPVATAFSTAAGGETARVAYDRRDSRALAPFPDDFWLAANPDDPTEKGLRIRAAGFGLPDQWLINALVRGVRGLDGFSPVGHLTIPLTHPAAASSLPSDFAESLAGDASVQLFDLTAGHPDFGLRVPLRVEARSEAWPGGTDHALLVYPSVALESGHRYGLVVTRRVLSARNQPFGPSLFFEEVLGAADSSDSWSVQRARELADEVLAIAGLARVAVERDDVALALRFSIRNTDGIPADLLEVRKAVFDSPPGRVHVQSVRAEPRAHVLKGSGVAAIVRGHFAAVDWRTANGQFDRDPESGALVAGKVRNLPFVLALPQAAKRGPVPVVLYQHGNPGQADEEVLRYARRSLAAAGFAVIGFDDVLNREVSPPGRPAAARANAQIVDILVRILAASDAPDHFAQTIADQLNFLRVIEKLAERTHFDVGSGRKPIAGIDPNAPLLYLGVSEGAHHGVMLLPFAPEIRAAALVSPGRRFSEILIHQRSEQLLAPLSFLGFGRLGPIDIWVALALIQMVFDDQDPHNFARFLYREPLELGNPDRASLLVVEGVADSLVPNHATHALLRTFGPIAHLAPAEAAVAGLAEVQGAISGNVDARTTAAFYQYVPQNVKGRKATPGCASPPLSTRSANEGHYCAQSAAEAVRQRDEFLGSALVDAAPRAMDPLDSNAAAN